jgi:hypothetical protein
LFDDNIEKKNQSFLPLEKVQPPLKLNTLHQRMNEALLWLIELCDKELTDSKYKSVDYLSYRNRVRFRPIIMGNKEGILFDWTNITKTPNRKSSSQTRGAEPINVNALESLGASHTVTKDWKTRVLDFIVNEDELTLSIDTPEEFGGYFLNEIDIEWLNKTLTSSGLEYQIGPQLIRAVK